MILAFSHPAIVVSDLEKASAFYQAMFGFKVLSEEGWSNSSEADRATGIPGGDCRGLMLSGHNCFLELFEFSSPAQLAPKPEDIAPHELGIRHIAFYVDDVVLETERFIALGGQRLGEPSFGAVYLRDPFGNVIELCEIPNAEENPLNLLGIHSLDNYSGNPS